MSKNLDFTTSNLSSILNLISLNNDNGQNPVDTTYEQVNDALKYTDELINLSALTADDDMLFDENYRERLKEIENQVQEKLLQEKSIIESSSNENLNDIIEKTDISMNSFNKLVSLAEQNEQNFEYIIPQDLGAISIEEVDDIPGQVIVTSIDINSNEVIAEHTFNVRLKGQLFDDTYKFDKIPFTNEYLLKDNEHILKDKKPRLIEIGDDKIGRITLHYDYVFNKAGEKIERLVTRKIKFIDTDDHEIDKSIIPENEDFTEILKFEGIYTSDGSINWKIDTQFFRNISMYELNKYLNKFGFKKTGPDIPSTKVLGNSEQNEFVEYVKVVPLNEEKVDVPPTIEPKFTFETRKHKRIIQFKLIDSNESISDDIKQTKIETYKVDENGKQFDIEFSKWFPTFDGILNNLKETYIFKKIKDIDAEKVIVYFDKKQKLALNEIYDIVSNLLDTMPSSLANTEYHSFKTINEIVNNNYDNNNLLMDLTYRYNDRMLNNINKLRTALGLSKLENLDLNGVALNMFIDDLKNKHYQSESTSSYIDYNFDILFEDNLYNKNFVGYGRDFSPEALADYIFKNILYEVNYIFEGDLNKWEHLNNLIKTKGVFIGLLYVENYKVNQSKNDKLPYNDIVKYIYKLSISNKYVLN